MHVMKWQGVPEAGRISKSNNSYVFYFQRNKGATICVCAGNFNECNAFVVWDGACIMLQGDFMGNIYDAHHTR